MSNYECYRCGITGYDLPDGLELSELFDTMYGECYCVGCLIAYEEHLWTMDEPEEDDGEDLQGEWN